MPNSRGVSRLAGDERGTALVYVTLLAGVLVGIGGLAVDASRVMSLSTEMQKAADAAAMAGASQLDRRAGARDRARTAAAQALRNDQSFADGGGGAITVATADCGGDGLSAGAGCIRFLSALPTQDGTAITDDLATDDDGQARFIEVRLDRRLLTASFLSALGITEPASVTAAAVAGNDRTVCRVPPVFFCNPTEPSGNTDIDLPVDMAALSGRQLRVVNPSGSQYGPGNFGYLCPTGDAHCNATTIRDLLGSTEGAGCLNAYDVTTKPGVSAGQTRAGLDARFDTYLSQVKSWRTDPLYPPAANVTQGGQAATQGQSCRHDPYTGAQAQQAMGLPRDGAFTGIVGNGTWNYAEYFRVNHGGNGTTGWRPTDWAGVTGLSSAVKPTRYDVYRYEIEASKIVKPGQTIGNSAQKTLENGNPQCYGGAVNDTVHWFPNRQADISLLDDRRALLGAVINCNANDRLNGRASFKPSEFVLLFLTEPMENTGNSAIHAEVLEAGPDFMDELAHDVIQLYRR